MQLNALMVQKTKHFIPMEKAFLYTAAKLVFLLILAGSVPAQTRAPENMEIITAEGKKPGWASSLIPGKKGDTTVVYLKDSERQNAAGLVPVLEFRLGANTFVSTPKGYLPAARLSRGDRVFCRRERDGALNTFEVGGVYNPGG